MARKNDRGRQDLKYSFGWERVIYDRYDKILNKGNIFIGTREFFSFVPSKSNFM